MLFEGYSFGMTFCGGMFLLSVVLSYYLGILTLGIQDNTVMFMHYVSDESYK